MNCCCFSCPASDIFLQQPELGHHTSQMNGWETQSDGIDETLLLASDPGTQTCTHLTLITDASTLSPLAGPHCSIRLPLSPSPSFFSLCYLPFPLSQLCLFFLRMRICLSPVPPWGTDLLIMGHAACLARGLPHPAHLRSTGGLTGR